MQHVIVNITGDNFALIIMFYSKEGDTMNDRLLFLQCLRDPFRW